MPPRRLLVASCPMSGPQSAAASADAPRVVPCSVGVLPWSTSTAYLTVVVRAAWAFDPAGTTPLPLRPIDAPHLHAGPPDPDRPRPDDFVPIRSRVDVALVGSIDVVPHPSGRIDARHLAVRRAGAGPTVVVDPGAPGPTALRPPATRRLGDGAPFDPAPRACHDGSPRDFVHEDHDDFGAYQSAPPELRFDGESPPGEPFLLVGLAPGDADRALDVTPPLEPRVIVDHAGADVGASLLVLHLDGLLVDPSGRLEASWRGHVEVVPPAHRDVDRLILAWAPPGRWEEDEAGALAEGLRELPHGEFTWAWDRDDGLRGEPPPALGEHELTMARHESWDFPDAPEPRIDLPRFVAVAAELAEQRGPRDEVLARHGTDPYRWSVEERAWAQRLARADDDDDGESLRAAYVAETRKARDALARPEEERMTPAEWVHLAARVERGTPTEELARAGLGLGAYVRLDERWRARAGEDPALAAELERLREEADRALEDAPLGPVDLGDEGDEDVA